MANDKLPVMEQFYTIQGEGRFTGHAAYFIRLAGCDVGCVWCDVKESWHTDNYPKISPKELADETSKNASTIVVITGGEPAMYDLSELCNELHDVGKKVHIETSGAHELKGQFDWVTLSPKKFKPPVSSSYAVANELKIIVFNKSDFEWAKQFRKLVPKNCLLYLQPEWSKRDEMEPLIIDFVKNNPEWNISLQTHKYLDIP
ncbi:MAG: radical SAM protein [Flavobacteriales bacterium]|nr:radical SAM protein [Flavobacteriales bacterium]